MTRNNTTWHNDPTGASRNPIVRRTAWMALASAFFLLALASLAQDGQRLDETWTVTANGQTIQVEPGGGFKLRNIPAPDQFGSGGPGTRPDFLGDDFVRVIGTRTVDGVTQWAFSEPFQIRQGQTFVLDNITITDTPPPLPVAIALTADPEVIALGDISQLTVIADLADGGVQDVTDREFWTIYRTSNPAIATVGENGLVTSHSVGSVFLTAVNEGATAVKRVIIASDVISTTIEGFVQLENGAAVGGALATTIGGGSATTDSNGFFSLQVTLPFGEGVIVRVTADVDGSPFAGTSELLTTIPGGLTDAGIIVLSEITTITLTPPNPREFNGTPAPDRGVGLERGAFITALGDFSISSLGIEADLTTASLTLVANIFAASGLSRGALLQTASATFADVGTAFYDVPINFSFVAGNDYDIAINFVPSAALDVRFFNFDPRRFGDPPYEVNGLVRVIDGEAGGGSRNFVLPHLRLDGGLGALNPASPLLARPPVSLEELSPQASGVSEEIAGQPDPDPEE